MNHPHVDQLARDALDDLGLVDDDHTEMTAAPALSGVRAPVVSRWEHPTLKQGIRQ